LQLWLKPYRFGTASAVIDSSAKFVKAECFTSTHNARAAQTLTRDYRTGRHHSFCFNHRKAVSTPTASQQSIRAMSNLPQFRDAVAAATETLRALSTLEPQMAQATDLIDQCLRAGNKLLVCGNGGSAADASHFATELVVRFARNRPALPAICLASDGGIVTAAANDYGFDEIFARQVMAFGRPGDVLIALTTSGNSQNVKRALQQAKARKLKTIALLGRDGASTIGIADVEFLVKGDSTARIQEAHQLLLHVLCEIIESRLDNP
jgi:D-sedoheptulose 7-phosphate isomerase